jgi:GTPase
LRRPSRSAGSCRYAGEVALEAADQEIVFGGDGAGHAAAGGDAVFAHLVFGDADDGEGAVDDDGAGVADVVGVREVAALF